MSIFKKFEESGRGLDETEALIEMTQSMASDLVDLIEGECIQGVAQGSVLQMLAYAGMARLLSLEVGKRRGLPLEDPAASYPSDEELRASFEQFEAIFAQGTDLLAAPIDSSGDEASDPARDFAYAVTGIDPFDPHGEDDMDDMDDMDDVANAPTSGSVQ